MAAFGIAVFGVAGLGMAVLGGAAFGAAEVVPGMLSAEIIEILLEVFSFADGAGRWAVE